MAAGLIQLYERLPGHDLAIVKCVLPVYPADIRPLRVDTAVCKALIEVPAHAVPPIQTGGFRRRQHSPQRLQGKLLVLSVDGNERPGAHQCGTVLAQLSLGVREAAANFPKFAVECGEVAGDVVVQNADGRRFELPGDVFAEFANQLGTALFLLGPQTCLFFKALLFMVLGKKGIESAPPGLPRRWLVPPC